MLREHRIVESALAQPESGAPRSAQTHPAEDAREMTGERAALIEEALAHTTGWEAGHFDRFRTESLRLFVEHLRSARRPRGRDAAWRRPGDTRAIVVYDPYD